MSMFLIIAKTVQFLHTKNILHRDIKPENILLDANFNPVFCDFGWSIQLDHGETRDTFCGTLEYIAPEVFKGDSYHKNADIWSLGILLYEMMHGYSPFKGKNYKEVSRKVLKGDVECDARLPSRVIDLIKSILKVNPFERSPLHLIITEISEILAIENFSRNREKNPYNMSLNLEGKEKVKILNLESTKPADPAKSNSPRFFKTPLCKLNLTKAETTRFPEDPVANGTKSQYISATSLIHGTNNRVKRQEDPYISFKAKQTINHNPNDKKKSKHKELKHRSDSGSDKKRSVSLSIRRKKLKVYLTVGIGDEYSHPESESFFQRTLKKKSKGLECRKDSEAVHLKNLGEIIGTPDMRKDKYLPLNFNHDSKQRQKVRKPSTSKEKKPQIISKGGKIYNKKAVNKTMSRNASKSKMVSKLSESQRLACKTPQERFDKEFFFKSMVNLQLKLENQEKEIAKSTLILNKISKKMSNSKSGLEKKRFKLQSPVAFTQKPESSSNGKEVFKPKAKSFRSAYSIFNISEKKQQTIKE